MAQEQVLTPKIKYEHLLHKQSEDKKQDIKLLTDDAGQSENIEHSAETKQNGGTLIPNSNVRNAFSEGKPAQLYDKRKFSVLEEKQKKSPKHERKYVNSSSANWIDNQEKKSLKRNMKRKPAKINSSPPNWIEYRIRK